MRHTIILSVALSAFGALSAQAPAPVTRPVDLAICLDTSGSMDGLIDAARRNLWAIVNDLALADPAPRLRVALLTFGNDGHEAERGWVAIDSGFTDDLDKISQQLFALKTNGGTEFVGRVLKTAVEELQWSADPQALRLIVGCAYQPKIKINVESGRKKVKSGPLFSRKMAEFGIAFQQGL